MNRKKALETLEIQNNNPTEIRYKKSISKIINETPS